MSEFSAELTEESVAEVREGWVERTDTFERVYDVVLGVIQPTPYTEIAELAVCSGNAARKHLGRLAEMGIVRADHDSRPARYTRNEGYLEWQEANRIADDLSVEEIITRVEALEQELDAFEDRFGTTSPDEVNVFDHADHDRIHELMADVSEWRTARRDVRLYELARRIASNDGHVVPA
jgi:DNA-binding transcriptional ArsR family regulator